MPVSNIEERRNRSAEKPAYFIAYWQKKLLSKMQKED